MGKYLKFYEKCIGAGRLPHDGLCKSFGKVKKFQRFIPTCDDFDIMNQEDKSTGYWGSGVKYNNIRKYCGFTPLRQTIVLFMAAMNNEL